MTAGMVAAVICCDQSTLYREDTVTSVRLQGLLVSGGPTPWMLTLTSLGCSAIFFIASLVMMEMLEAGSRTALATVESPVGPVRRTLLVITSFSFLYGEAIVMLVEVVVASSTGVAAGVSSSCSKEL